MAFVSAQHLLLASVGLRGSHGLTAVSIPAVLRASALANVVQPASVEFGSRAETDVLDMGFRLRDGDKPYLAVWNNEPQFVNKTYGGTTLQRQRVSDASFAGPVFISQPDPATHRRTHFELNAQAGPNMVAANRAIQKIDLAIWLGRRQDVASLQGLLAWFDQTFPPGQVGLDQLYLDNIPAEYERLDLIDRPVDDEAVAAALDVDLEYTAQEQAPDLRLARAHREDADEGLDWTVDLCSTPLQGVDVDDIISRVVAELALRHMVFPDVEVLTRRCVSALLTGHLILTGPPGTGKTTFAKLLAREFNVALLTSTATSEWNPYHVVGGLRPNGDRGFAAHHGHVSKAVIECARTTRDYMASPTEDRASASQGVWLLIDEFNRADIDAAIGSLYTVLAATTGQDRRDAPIDLWFETTPDRQRLYMPGTFRIVAAMNDVDTSFVSALSQGLTRRFTQVPVMPPPSSSIESELSSALTQAYLWCDEAYGRGAGTPLRPFEDITAAYEPVLARMVQIVRGLRDGDRSVQGWPLGTAQVVDVLRSLVSMWELATSDPTSDQVTSWLDICVADRLVPQMGSLDDDQIEHFGGLFSDATLPLSATAVTRLRDPNAMS